MPPFNGHQKYEKVTDPFMLSPSSSSGQALSKHEWRFVLRRAQDELISPICVRNPIPRWVGLAPLYAIFDNSRRN